MEQTGLTQVSVSRMRAEEAPHTIGKYPRSKPLFDFSDVDWTREYDIDIAARKGCSPGLVSHRRKNLAPETMRTYKTTSRPGGRTSKHGQRAY